jgi:hypothetical protein
MASQDQISQFTPASQMIPASTRQIQNSPTSTPRLASTGSYVSRTYSLCHGSFATNVAQYGTTPTFTQSDSTVLAIVGASTSIVFEATIPAGTTYSTTWTT